VAVSNNEAAWCAPVRVISSLDPELCSRRTGVVIYLRKVPMHRYEECALRDRRTCFGADPV